jgi:hypothetical protein
LLVLPYAGVEFLASAGYGAGRSRGFSEQLLDSTPLRKNQVVIVFPQTWKGRKVKEMFRKLWNDERGFIISAELVLVATLLVIGMIVGLTILRNQVVQELGDLAMAIGMLSQGYWYPGVEKDDGGSIYAQTDGSNYEDALDACQTATASNDPDNAPPAGMSVTSPVPNSTDTHEPGEGG